MKICPVCDSKIEGTWCANCHRFVKPWIIKEDIYINERHPSDETSCNFHNSENNEVHTAPAAQRYRSTQKVPASPKNVQNIKNTRSTRKSRKSRVGLIIVLVYFAIVCIGSIISSIADYIDEIMDRYDDARTYEYQYSDYDTDDWKDIEFYEDTNPEHEFLNSVGMKYAEKDEYGWGYQYFDEDELRAAGFECDEPHLEMTISGLKTKAYDLYGSSRVYFDKYSDYMFNYRVFYLGDEYSYYYEPTTVFETYYYTDMGNIEMDVSVDTASDRVHYYEFVGTEYSEEVLETIYLWLDAYYYGVFSSYDDFRTYMSQVKESGDYQYIDCDDSVGYISFYCDNNMVEVMMSPY